MTKRQIQIEAYMAIMEVKRLPYLGPSLEMMEFERKEEQRRIDNRAQAAKRKTPSLHNVKALCRISLVKVPAKDAK